MAARGQPVRLAVLTTLGRVAQAGMASSDLANLVGLPRNLMSADLAILTKADGVASRKYGLSVLCVARAAPSQC